MAKKKEPMIGKESRPTAIDYDAPISDWKVRDLVAVLNSQMERLKYTPIPEELKPELKPEWYKPERLKPEIIKGEKELVKPEKELLKPEKEILKPEQLKPELLKVEKEFEIPDLVEKVATRVVEMLEERGLFK
jgi:hypothetical protein